MEECSIQQQDSAATFPPLHRASKRRSRTGKGINLREFSGAWIRVVDYRLDPEHRRPAAIDDGAAVLLWLRGQAARSPTSSNAADPWLSELADPRRVFIAGESAGGILTHHLDVRFSGARALHHVRLRGFVAPRDPPAARCPHAGRPQIRWRTARAAPSGLLLSLPFSGLAPGDGSRGRPPRDSAVARCP